MKFEVRKQTQWTWFNKLVRQENYAPGLDVVIAYSTTIIDKLRKYTNVKSIKRNTFYLSIKIDTDEFNTTYQGSVNRVLYAAEAKCNHVIGWGADLIHFKESDPVIHITVNDSEYFLIEID